MLMKRFLLLAFFIALCGVVATPHDAHAIKLTPTLISLKLKPGETSTQTIKVTNTENTTLTFAPVLYEASAGDNEQGFPKIRPKDTSSTLANWITFKSEGVTLESGASQEVAAYIIVPKDAPAGGNYAVIGWVPTQTTNPSQDTSASLTGGAAVNVAVDVAGDVIEKADIVSFATEGNVKKFDKLPVIFDLRISNTGNRHFRPEGAITIKDMFGKSIAELPIVKEKDPANILPKSIRNFKVLWDKDFAFGKYTATANVILGGAGQKMATYEFWVMPAGLAILWVIILLVILVILVLLIKNMMGAVKKK